MELFILWPAFGQRGADYNHIADNILVLDDARVLSHQPRGIVSGVAIYIVVVVRTVSEWRDNVSELTVKKNRPYGRFFISLKPWHWDRRYLNILIPILLHNQGCIPVIIQCGGLTGSVCFVLRPIAVVLYSVAKYLLQTVEH